MQGLERVMFRAEGNFRYEREYSSSQLPASSHGLTFDVRICYKPTSDGGRIPAQTFQLSIGLHTQLIFRRFRIWLQQMSITAHMYVNIMAHARNAVLAIHNAVPKMNIFGEWSLPFNSECFMSPI